MPIDYGSNDVSTSGNFVAVSGNFTTALTVNNVPVATGTSISITNATDNRVLTSSNTGGEINAESNLTFNGTTLGVTGVIDIDNLRLDGNTISSSNSNGNIVLAPNGTGDVQVDADTLRVGDINAAATITTNGTGNLTINTNGGINSGSIVIQQGSNSDIILEPNGAGQLQGSSTGNARGSYAVDWQRVRALNTQVASGNYGVIGGGRNNTSSGSYSSVGGGRRNTSSSNYSRVSGGKYNTSGGAASTVGGGNSNSTSGYVSTVGGGFLNTSSNYASAVGGGRFNTSSGIDSTVGGGRSNISSGGSSTLSGGNSNTSSGYASALGGGRFNTSSGYGSAVSGGFANTGSGYASVVGGGRSNTSSNIYSTVSGGRFNTGSGIDSTVGGGNTNTSSGSYSSVGGGKYNTSSGESSTITGGIFAVASLYGEEARSSGKFNVQGDAQVRKFILRNKSTGGSPVILYLNGNSEELIIPENSTWFYTIKIVGRDADNIESAGYKIEGVLERNSLVTLLLSETKTVSYEDNPNWDTDLSIVNNDTTLRISCTVESGQTNVYWVAYAEIVQVIVPSVVPSYS